MRALLLHARVYVFVRARVREGERKEKREGGRELRAGGNSCVLECVYPGGDP